MPTKWMESGRGLHLCTLSQKEIEGWALKALRPEVDKATKTEADFIVEEENFLDFMFKRSSLKSAILDGAENAFGTLIPHPHRASIVSIRNVVDWLVQRVEVARPVPSYSIPTDVNLYLEMLNQVRSSKRLKGQELQADFKAQAQDAWRDAFDWDFQKPPSEESWLTEYVRAEADRILVEREQGAALRLAEERKAQAREAAMKTLAERKAKALAMKALLQEKMQPKPPP